MGTEADFAKLFEGNKQTFGQWCPKDGKMFTAKGEYTQENFNKHINGVMGIGIVPIMEEGSVMWGAIDIDNHSGDDPSANIEVVARTVFAKGIPLVPCRSKSGGVHCYLFMSEAVPAALLKKLLHKWAAEIGFPDAEVFPKQTELRDNVTGNWINLPYFGEHTVRYALAINEGGSEKLTLDQFVRYAETCKLSKAMLKSFVLAGHEQAPPCLQELIINGVQKGMRNEALYGFTIYLKKRFPIAVCRQEVSAINQMLFESPVTIMEVNKTFQSASRKGYKYKCAEEPFRKYCDSKVCLTREYGIEVSEVNSLGEGMPEFQKLRVMDTEPPIWELTVNEKIIFVATRELRTFPLLAEEIMAKLFIVTPLISQKDWMMILAELMKNLEHIEVPDNASVDGVIRERLIEFIDRADFNSAGKDPSDKDLILRGLPVIQQTEVEGKRVVMFRGGDFISYLKRTRSEELKGTALWMAIRKMGVVHKRTRLKGKVMNVWALPVDGMGRTKLDWDYDHNSVFYPQAGKNIVRLLQKANF